MNIISRILAFFRRDTEGDWIEYLLSRPEARFTDTGLAQLRQEFEGKK